MLDKSNKIIENEGTNSTDLFTFKIELQKELHKLLNFWSTEVIDEKYGGFLGKINHFGQKFPKSSKGIILNTRILWTFSAAYRTSKIERYKAIADISYQYLNKHFLDTKNGGVFWEVDYRGEPINKRKQAYAQSFAIYAYAEYYRVTKNKESLYNAKSLYKVLEVKFWDVQHSGYVEAFAENWNQIEDMRLSEKDLNAPKSMNTHLHILEAYSNLYRVWPNKTLKKSIADLLGIFKEKIIDENSGHFNLFFDMDWKIRSEAISFGHNIEGAWLLHEAAIVINDKQCIEKNKKIALKLVDITLNEGFDTDGSLFNEYENNKLDKEKHWWSQAEAMVGLMDAYEIDPKPTYLRSIFKLWNFIQDYLIDSVNGEWFWRIDGTGKIIETDDKVGFWKCPYHNSRALMELIERINNLNHDK
ncbi:AGE family epimerase/isomerase [Lutibacter aestuarii]|uniref:Cellobiose 2-epimerase n=1 Tax=Lutibacter aestuarii TaxID=861111 RepID=A0ABW2ZA37_9FLAO